MMKKEGEKHIIGQTRKAYRRVDEGGCGSQKRDVCRYVYGRVQAIGKTYKLDLLRCLPTCAVPGFEGAWRKLMRENSSEMQRKKRNKVSTREVTVRGRGVRSGSSDPRSKSRSLGSSLISWYSGIT